MADKSTIMPISAARVTASLFGVLAGLGGLPHGIGETLQGNIAPSGIVINSWTKGPIAAYMGGEPALTLAPNLLVAGSLTIIISLAVVAWSAALVQRKYGGATLLLLSILLLLSGGGFGPPIIGILAGVAGAGINVHYHWWRKHLPVLGQRLLASLWPWVFGACALNGMFLVIGSVILVYVFGVNNPDMFVNSFFFAVGSLLATILTGVAYDLSAQERGTVRA